ncbi:MAG: T9SS type A sorting domain-containing protein [Ignavibacteria bacterium]
MLPLFIHIVNERVPVNDKVLIKVYDILGREIAELVNDTQKAGKYSINFNATHLSSGVYFYSITAGYFRQVKKMILAK